MLDLNYVRENIDRVREALNELVRENAGRLSLGQRLIKQWSEARQPGSRRAKR